MTKFYITPNEEGYDNPFVLCQADARLAYKRLSEMGDSALTFNSPLEALEFINENPIDCGDPTYLLEEVCIAGERDFIWVEEDRDKRRRAAGK